MATSVQEAERMIEAAAKADVMLLAGHTQSFTVPIRKMRRTIVSGELGRLCAIHIWSHSDWMLRPRTPMSSTSPRVEDWSTARRRIRSTPYGCWAAAS